MLFLIIDIVILFVYEINLFVKLINYKFNIRFY